MDEHCLDGVLTRRAFGKSVLTAGIVVAAGSFLLDRPAEAAVTDVDILTFALNLPFSLR
jgi:hypothetical protein